MNLNIVSEKEEKLLKRKFISAEINFKGATPKTSEVKNLLASKTGSDKNLVVVKVIKNKYNSQEAEVIAYAYNSLDALKKLEKYEEPEKPAEEEKKEEQPAENKETTEEKPAEEEKKKEGDQ